MRSPRPSDTAGTFRVSLDDESIWDRKTEDRFPEIKELKQYVRDRIAQERDIGHSDTGREYIKLADELSEKAKTTQRTIPLPWFSL